MIHLYKKPKLLIGERIIEKLEVDILDVLNDEIGKFFLTNYRVLYVPFNDIPEVLSLKWLYFY
jgi:hypothetical protein